MISVAEAVQKLARTYQRNYAQWAVDGFGPALELPLHPPTDRQSATDMAGVADWIASWHHVAIAGLDVQWEQRRWPNAGTQQVPVRLKAATAEAVAAFTGHARVWKTAVHRAAALLQMLPAERERQPIAKALGKIVALDDEDFTRLADVLAWFAAHPEPGLYARQIPVHGIDSKWLEKRTKLVLDLHRALTGRESLGLAVPEPLHRVRFLDPALAPAGLLDLAAPVQQLAALPLDPQAVLVVENLQTLLSLPSMPGVVALFGAGIDVRWCAELPWMDSTPLYYWGDLDAAGLHILNMLRTERPDAISLMMDLETLQSHTDLTVPDPNGATTRIPERLTSTEVQAFQALAGRRLEQERLDWPCVLNQLSAIGAA